LTIAVPKDTLEFKKIIELSQNYNGPLAIRYPRDGKKIENSANFDDYGLKNFSWERLTDANDDCVILACGERMIERALKISQILHNEGVEVGVINARFVKPLDETLLNSLTEKLIITLEDNMILGGFGSLVCNYFSASNKIIKNFGYIDQFIPHGGVNDLINEFGVDTNQIVEYIKKYANR
jgi:1-deoxy-D-xylulose-5-phosphate synthase